MTALYFLAGLLACWIADPLHLPLLADNQHYYFIAERAAAGVPPHVSHFDPKHTLSLLLSSAAMLAGREVGVSDVHAARALSIVVTAGAVALMWPATRRLSGSVLAAHLASIAMLGFSRFVIMGAMGVRPKVFLVFFIVLALLWLAEQRPLATGVAAAAAFLCWQPALMFLAAGPPALLLAPSRGRRIALYAVGALVPIAIYHGYFVANGALADQIEQAYRFPSAFMSSFPPPWRGVKLHATWILGLNHGIRLQSLVPLTALAAAVVFWTIAVARPRQTRRMLAGRPDRVYFLICGHAAVAFDLWSYQGFPDRFLVEPFMAASAGMLGAAVVTWTARLGRQARIAAAAVAVLWVASPISAGEYRIKKPYTLAEQEALAGEVGSLLDRGVSVWAVGCTHLLGMAHANNWVSIGFFFRGVERYLYEVRGHDPYLPMRDGRMPDVVLWSRSKLRDAMFWLPRMYRLAHAPSFRAQGVRLWYRRDSAAAELFSRDSRAPAGDR